MRSISFEARKLQSELKPVVYLDDTTDKETINDDLIVQRLEELAFNIKNEMYDEETKQAIYYYAENFLDVPTPSEYMKQASEAVKYFVTGWWIHSLIDDKEKLTPNIEEKQ